MTGRIRAALLVLAAGVLAAVPASAVDVTSIFGDIQFKYLHYREEVKDWVADLESVTGDLRSASRVFRKGDRFRIESSSPTAELPPDAEALASVRRTLIYDGHDAWAINGPGRAPEKQPVGSVPELAVWQYWWEHLDGGAALDGLEAVDGIDCLVIAVTPSELFPRSKLWVDKREFRLLKAQGLNEQGQDVIWRYDDYRVLGDWEFPFKIMLTVKDGPTVVYRVKTMKINKDLADGIFRLPATGASAAA